MRIHIRNPFLIALAVCVWPVVVPRAFGQDISPAVQQQIEARGNVTFLDEFFPHLRGADAL